MAFPALEHGAQIVPVPSDLRRERRGRTNVGSGPSIAAWALEVGALVIHQDDALHFQRSHVLRPNHRGFYSGWTRGSTWSGKCFPYEVMARFMVLQLPQDSFDACCASALVGWMKRLQRPALVATSRCSLASMPNIVLTDNRKWWLASSNKNDNVFLL